MGPTSASKTTSRDFRELFNKVQPVRGFEDIAMQIQHAVSTGRLKSGDRLPSERELAVLFNVSRSTVREAIRVLEAERIVEVRRGANGGILIVEPTPDHVGKSLEALIRFRGATVQDLAEFRAEFEGRSAYWAAKRATPEQVERLLAIAAKMGEMAEKPDIPWSRLVEHDLLFHEEVARASQNQIRVAIMLAIHGVFLKTSLGIERMDHPDWRRQQADDLERIAGAIQRRAAETARQAMEEHVMRNVLAGIAEEGIPGETERNR